MLELHLFQNLISAEYTQFLAHYPLEPLFRTSVTLGGKLFILNYYPNNLSNNLICILQFSRFGHGQGKTELKAETLRMT